MKSGRGGAKTATCQVGYHTLRVHHVIRGLKPSSAPWILCHCDSAIDFSHSGLLITTKDEPILKLLQVHMPCN